LSIKNRLYRFPFLCYVTEQTNTWLRRKQTTLDVHPCTARAEPNVLLGSLLSQFAIVKSVKLYFAMKRLNGTVYFMKGKKVFRFVLSEGWEVGIDNILLTG
jgi:hypothetical protein